MKKLLHWEKANKLAIIFGIIGGLYLIFQSVNYIISDKLVFESEILINDFYYPKNNAKYSFYEQAEHIVPSTFTKYDVSRNIADSLTKKLKWNEHNWFSIRDNIEKALPNELNQRFLVDKIDSLILKETYPMRKTSCFIETFINNNGDKIAKELRFELPANGYYELYLNKSLINKGDFRDHIFIGELRPENIAMLRIWSFEHLSDYYINYTKQIKYTFDNGYIIPTILTSIRTSGFLYWIYKNPIWAIYFLIFLPLYLTFMIVINLKSNKNDNKKIEKQPIT